ncbi:hypothetical protein [Paenibacillus sp. UNC451MF]|uniref:hypothetical protein n=1 Tax=Paenibacillus sp. UNC451MF TaxID=1449063 RepID=UPI000A76F2D2|nr:hypothetical protein [Paenibacillus sp. UNC451MF]
MMGKATELMLQAAKVKPVGKVLDVAAGIGEQSIMAARLVGPHEPCLYSRDTAAYRYPHISTRFLAQTGSKS